MSKTHCDRVPKSMSRTSLFFATRYDLKCAFEIIEKKIKLKYIRAGRHSTLPSPVFYNLSDIPSLGLASNESSISCNAYFVAHLNLIVNVRKLSSSPMFAFDQLLNPQRLFLRPEGCGKQAF